MTGLQENTPVDLSGINITVVMGRDREPFQVLDEKSRPTPYNDTVWQHRRASRRAAATADSSDERGTVTKASSLETVMETLKCLRRAVQKKGLEEFALIDHGGAAERAMLKRQEAKFLVFGSPNAGRPLMVASPLLALDLPLKVLVWRERDGGVLVSHDATSYLARRHDITDDLVGNIAGIEPLVWGALEKG